jgi:hypothetical protein
MTATIKFDAHPTGSAPSGWTTGVTGHGAHRWTVEGDANTSGDSKVLMQSGRGDFPWCVKSDVSFADGFVETRFKPVAGAEDQAGGLIWRWKDGDNYYVARANALEDNVSLYYTRDGRRITIKYVEAPVAPSRWHLLRVEFAATRIRVVFDGVPRIEVDDDHIVGSGRVGVWTKADSVTAFDDFAYGQNL